MHEAMPPIPTTPPPPFQPFYVAHRAAVLRLLVGMVGPDDAHDCFQDTWLKVLRAWPPRDADGRLDSWVLTVAHRTALDELRRRRTRELAAAELPEQADPATVLPSLGPSELHAAVAALPERQRATILLRGVLDLSHAQVAEVIGDGCTVEAARRAYADGLASLRRTIGAPR
jgi:RNA polymerase sigma factor (sigma-70 family)